MSLVAAVHRFRNTVAVSVGDGPTTRLSPEAARKLAQALADCAFDIVARPAFHETAFQPVEVDHEQR